MCVLPEEDRKKEQFMDQKKEICKSFVRVRSTNCKTRSFTLLNNRLLINPVVPYLSHYIIQFNIDSTYKYFEFCYRLYLQLL